MRLYKDAQRAEKRLNGWSWHEWSTAIDPPPTEGRDEDRAKKQTVGLSPLKGHGRVVGGGDEDVAMEVDAEGTSSDDVDDMESAAESQSVNKRA